MFSLNRSLAKSALRIHALPVRLFGSSATFFAKELQIEKTASPKPHPEYESLVFGRTFSDHMLEVDWTAAGGWGAPRIVPYHNLSISPASSSLHYALQCFEGLKAYVDDQNQIRLFRPEKNMERMISSCARLSLPTFDGKELLESLKKLLVLEKSWIPKARGYSLYIRPTCISTDTTLGVGSPQAAKLFIILSPVGPYYKEGFNPVRLFADDKNVRACVGGTGGYKIGGNYGGTIMPQKQAASKGFAQVLWLYGDRQYVSEVGTMNFFVLWKNEKGERELVTAPLDDGTILPGVVRDSILALARKEHADEMKVSERLFTIADLTKAIDEGRVEECFGAGTAAIVSPVKGIHFAGKDYIVPIDEKLNAGKFTSLLANKIMDIQYGRKPSPWSVVVQE
ncbi:mitochondrial branched-chain amino acid degradation aminotransferase [Andalucia godoyi]|uniref:Branched-chain-amino-acid aminotransferase n=1 Tax=Andalucia godoyi TaxID=505711 RepID=A0A8K0AI73_ANDGO|nr:mitochondrial branched-chain amino acid degradation aminotransferase [Andalucia godoyi]|eukprot:ANDGO_03743.mRNA.1 mitochondrial branched-chain amino acid degradation aminotransferase